MERKDKYDFLVDVGRTFDGKNGLVDCRGRHIGGKYLINTKGCDFTGSVLYKCTPKLSNTEAFQIGSLSESNLLSTISIKSDMDAPKTLADYVFDNINARGTWTLYHVDLLNSRIANSYFRDMRLHGCSFMDMEFDHVELAISEMTHTYFENCSLEDAILTDIEIMEYYYMIFFKACTIRNVKFADFKFGRNCEFNTVNLENVEFINCSFEGIEFHRTEFANVKFTNCEYGKIEFYGCTYRGSLDPHISSFGGIRHISEM